MTNPNVPILDYAPAPRSRLKWLKLVIGPPLIVIILYFVGRALLHSFREIDWHHLHVHYGYVGLSLVSLLCARLTNAINCKQVLGAMGAKVKASQVVPIIWVASLGRYIPGKVSVVAGAVLMLMRLGVRLPVAVASLFLSTAMMILIGLIACTPLMFTPVMREKMPHGHYLSLLLLAVGGVGLHPYVFTKLCNIALVKMKREPLPHRLELAPYTRAIINTIGRTVFLGLALFFASRALKPISMGQFPLTFSSAGLASVAGFLAVFAPAGLGVHEGIYILTMTPVLGPLAGLLAVMFRFLNVSADAIAGGIGGFLLRANSRLDERSLGGEIPVAP
jgi:hypothetical protein